MLRNTNLQYGVVSKFLHWLIILVVFTMLSIGFLYDDVGSKALEDTLIRFHKSLGLIVLTLAIVMILWRCFNSKPQWPADMPKWEKALARLTHALLYLLLVLMPLAGWTMSTAANKPPLFFGLFIVKAPFVPVNKTLAEIASETHEIVAWILLVLITLHTLGALKHYFIDKNNLLQRMCGK